MVFGIYYIEKGPFDQVLPVIMLNKCLADILAFTRANVLNQLQCSAKCDAIKSLVNSFQ